MKKYIRYFAAICCAIAVSQTTHSQILSDTLRLSSGDAETIFLKNNLGLLAEKLNIDIAQAAVIQAKAWPNPNLTVEEIQLYTNSTTDQSPALFGNFWRNRTFSAQLEQLIHTAGKRRKNINLQVQNKTLAESTFNDILASLKIDFRQQVAELVYQQQVLNNYQLQSTLVASLVKARQGQFREGNISQAEWYRIKALQMNLQTEINAVRESLSALQQTIKTLMAVDPKTYLYFNSDGSREQPSAGIENHTLEELLSASQQNNTALRVYANEVKVNQATVALEKANRVPDLTLNSNYDRNGNNQLNFVGLGVSMDLPLFNRNKGNIKSAELALDRTTLLKQQREKEIANTIVKYWTDLSDALALYRSADTTFINQTDVMLAALGRNFEARNINLLEFLDYFESFRDSKNNFYENLKNIRIKKEELNYLTGLEL